MSGNNPPLCPCPLAFPGNISYDKMSKAELYDALYDRCLKDTGNEDQDMALSLLMSDIKLQKNLRRRAK